VAIYGACWFGNSGSESRLFECSLQDGFMQLVPALLSRRLTLARQGTSVFIAFSSHLRGLNADQRRPKSFCTSVRMLKSAISLMGISRVTFTSFFAWSISKFRPSAGMPPSWLITFTVAS
jgi:hypothetical protein